MLADYKQEYARAVVRSEHLPEINAVVDKIIANRAQYFDPLEKVTNIPWWCLAAITTLESNLDFERHLHNGDPLSDRTKHYPPGRPLAGEPPFTWQESAEDALLSCGMWKPHTWDFQGCMEFLERYNGAGYRKSTDKEGKPLTDGRPMVSPYIGSYTTLYAKGKFTEVKNSSGGYDVAFDSELVSQEVGAMALFKILEARGLVSFP